MLAVIARYKYDFSLRFVEAVNVDPVCQWVVVNLVPVILNLFPCLPHVRRLGGWEAPVMLFLPVLVAIVADFQSPGVSVSGRMFS